MQNPTPDFHERIALLRCAENNPTWNAVMMSMRDNIDEVRMRLESNLDREDDPRYLLRVILRCYQKMEDGTFLENSIQNLQGQIAALEQKAEKTK